jgi:hypothetical protein
MHCCIGVRQANANEIVGVELHSVFDCSERVNHTCFSTQKNQFFYNINPRFQTTVRGASIPCE